MSKEIIRILYKHIDGEMWCSIPGHSRYFANKKGEVLGVRGKVLKPHINKYGYPVVPVVDNSGRRKTPTVHRFIAKCFVYNKHPDINIQVDHIDGVKHNNNHTNLEWVTNKENAQRAVKNGLNNPNFGESHHMSVLSNEEIVCIYTSYDTHTNLARKYNTSTSNIYDIRKGNIWKSVTEGLDNREQKMWLEHGIRGQSIESVREIYTSKGMYKDIAKKFNTGSNTVSKIKNDEVCSIFTAGLQVCKNETLTTIDEAKNIYESSMTFKELAKEYDVTVKYIENIKSGHLFKKYTKDLVKGNSSRLRKVTKQEIIYIYTSDKEILELSDELGIKKSTIRAIKSQQNHKKITDKLKKGGC